MLLSLQVKGSISEDSKAPARNNAQTFNIDPEPLKGSRTISPVDQKNQNYLFSTIKIIYFLQSKLFILYNQNNISYFFLILYYYGFFFRNKNI